MKRIFTTMGIAALLVILSIGSVIVWLANHQLNQANQITTKVTAEGLSLNLAAEIDILQQLVNTLAQSPATVSALSSSDIGQMQQVATQLEKYIPGVLKVRLLPANTTEIDNSSSPVMGYADLDMIRESFTNQQLAAIHDQGVNQHLAIAAKCVRNNTAIGVLLASIKVDVIFDKLQKLNPEHAYLALLQGDKQLMQRGPTQLKDIATNLISVANTHWNVQYGTDTSIDWADLSIYIGLILLSLLLIAGLIYLVYNRLQNELLRDQEIVLKAIQELNKPKGKTPYAPNFESTRTIILSLLEHNRINNQGAVKSAVDLKAERLNAMLENAEDSSFQSLLQDPRQASLPSKNTTSVTPNKSTKKENHGSVSDIFRAYDIRGIVDKTLTKDIVYNIGRAFGSTAKEQGITKVVIGYDGRLSSPGFAEVLAKAIVTTGVDVIDIGMIPTPVLYYAAHHLESHSGVMITGSHNPPTYNGLKLVLNGVTLAEAQIQALRQRINAEDYITGTPGSIVRNSRYTNDYIGTISDDIHIVRPMKIVMDCGNGVTGSLGPLLLKTLGCEVIELFCDIDGKFPNHHPDPSKPENLRDLISAVQHYHADVGIAFDGDGDRLGIIDSKGRIIWPDRQMMLFAREVLKARPGATVIYDVKCSKYLEQQITEFGGQPIMWKSGHSLMKAKIKETGAKFAGEMSGHFFFNDRWFGFDDALYAASRMIEILSADSRNSAEVFASFPDSYNTPELNIPLPESEKFSFIETLRKTANFPLGRTTEIDGLRVDFADGWGLVRASNTTPSLVVRFEADDQPAMERIQAEFKKLLLNTNPNLLLPF